MKKVKIMLMSLAVLAIVGGALAFKAAKFNKTFCTIAAQSTDASNYYCPDNSNWVGSKVCVDLPAVTVDANNNAFTTNVCTILKQAGQDCAAVQCNALTTVYQDQ